MLVPDPVLEWSFGFALRSAQLRRLVVLEVLNDEGDENEDFDGEGDDEGE